MFKPELFENTNTVSRTNASECLKRFAKTMKWVGNGVAGCRVLDVGCGDGSVTAGVLRRFLPRGFAQLVGADIGPEMVAYANARYGDHRTSFIQLDIAGEIPTEITGKFDLVFSSFTMHWVPEQQKAFKNIYKVLADIGNCLILFLAYSRTFDLYRVLKRQTKWQLLLHDAEKYISPYHDVQDPVIKLKRLMEDIGFNHIHVECERKSYIYDEHSFKDVMLSINPFKIPSHLVEDLLADYMKAAWDLNIVSIVDNTPRINIEYTLLTARSEK